MAVCPLSILSGNQKLCGDDCAYCPPRDFEQMSNNTKYFDYLQCLNFPNDMFGNGAAIDGLQAVANSIDNLANAIDGKVSE